MRELLRSFCIGIGGVAVLTVVAAYCLGFRLLSVQSNSMQPIFQKGDLLLVRHGSGYHAGDILTYEKTVGITVSHRLLSATDKGLVLKGDNLGTQDPVINPEQVRARALAVLPGGGAALDWIRSTKGLALVVYIPACLYMTTELYTWQLTQRPWRAAR